MEQERTAVELEAELVRAGADLSKERLVPDLQRAAASSESLHVRRYVALNRTLTPEVQLRIARDPSNEVRSHLAGNPALTLEAMELLRSDPDPYVRADLGRNRNLPHHLQVALMEDADQLVRSLLACNSHLAPDLQGALTGDVPFVRRSLGSNPGLAVEVQELLAGDPDVAVRHALAGNSSLAAEVQPLLASDPAGEVRDAVGRNSATRVTRRFPVPYCLGHHQRWFEQIGREENLEPEAWMVLAGNWAGTVDELVSALRALHLEGPEPSKAPAGQGGGGARQGRRPSRARPAGGHRRRGT